MAIEIERRFLVKGFKWEKFVKSEIKIRQGYFPTEIKKWSIRIRIIDNKESLITVKSSKNDVENYEFEYKIPIHDAEKMWDLLEYKIVKTRYSLILEDGDWVIDCFEEANKPLIIAEVELSSKNDEIEIPSWCIKEITGDKSLSNAALAKEPIAHREQKENQFPMDL